MIETVKDQLTDLLEPMLYPGAEDLDIYLGGLATPFEFINIVVSDDDGKPGWSLLIDIDRAPDEALPWLAQFVGVTLPGGLAPADQRQQIKSLANMARGTVSAMRGAPAPYLTGDKTVVFRERYDVSNPAVDSPYYLSVITYLSETPDPISALNALLAQKPGGIVMNYRVLNGQDYQQVKDNFLSYADVKAEYATYQGLRANEPGI